MKKVTLLSIIGIGLAVLTPSLHSANDSGSGPGKTRFGGEASEWSSLTPKVTGDGAIIPIGGSGQVNGNFVTAERNGIQIGIRATERFVGNLPPVVVDNKIGFYSALTGTSGLSTLGRAKWNDDLHIDLRGAFGVAKNTTLTDYDLVLETNISPTNIIFGLPVPLDIKLFATLANGGNDSVALYQTSLNPKFGNPAFNALVPGVYTFRLVLTPKTFNGPPLAAEMSVVVTSP